MHRLTQEERLRNRAERFLAYVRKRQPAASGALFAWEKRAAADFLRGAAVQFPEAGDARFLTALSKIWARTPSFREDSFLMGAQAGKILKKEWREALEGGLPKSFLERLLHLRETGRYLRLAGGLLAQWHHDFRRGRMTEEVLRLAEANRASLLYRSFHNADLDYPKKAIEALPDMLEALRSGAEVLRRRQPEAARALEQYRSSILYRALSNGDFNYPAKTVQAVAGIVQCLEVSKADPKKREEILYKTLNGGNLDYPRRILGSLPGRRASFPSNLAA